MTLALEGIKVLDLTRLAPGPYCTMILADLGADVLKIEEPGPPTGRRAEQAAGLNPDAPRPLDRNSPYNAMNRNKKSMGLNLKNEEARKIFHKLAETADVLVEEFRPGVSKRLGIDYDTLSKINPRIIYCAVTGYGQDGPYRDLVGHDINYISHAGALGIIGPEDGPPSIPHNILADFAGGGMHAAVGVLAALVARERTGRGQIVDIAMTDGVVSMQVALLAMHYAGKDTARRGGTMLSGKSPHYNVYQTRDGKYLSLGSIEPWFYANLCKALGREDYLPHEFNKEKHPEIKKGIAEIIKTKTRDEWFKILSQTDICVGKIYDYEELENDPQLKHREMIVEVNHPTEGKVKQVGISVKLSDTPGAIRFFPPELGEHTNEVLSGLGYAKKEIERLRAEGAIK